MGGDRNTIEFHLMGIVVSCGCDAIVLVATAIQRQPFGHLGVTQLVDWVSGDTAVTPDVSLEGVREVSNALLGPCSNQWRGHQKRRVLTGVIADERTAGGKGKQGRRQGEGFAGPRVGPGDRHLP